MGGGPPLVRALHAVAPEVKVVALGVSEVEDEVMPLVEAGASGDVTRDSSPDELAASILGVADGGPLCSPRMVATFLRPIATLSCEERRDPADATLTSRGVEIVRLI